MDIWSSAGRIIMSLDKVAKMDIVRDWEDQLQIDVIKQMNEDTWQNYQQLGLMGLIKQRKLLEDIKQELQWSILVGVIERIEKKFPEQ